MKQILAETAMADVTMAPCADMFEMGIFNLWVKGTPMEQVENHHVDAVAELLMRSCAYHYMKHLLVRLGASAEAF